MSHNTANDFTHFQDGIRENMRQALRDARISQQQLAERLGTNKSYVSKVLRGKHKLSLKFLWKFANEVCSGDLYSLLPESEPRECDPMWQYAEDLFRHARHAGFSKSYTAFESGIQGRLWEVFQSENLSYNELEKKLECSLSTIYRVLNLAAPAKLTLEFLYMFVENVPSVNWVYLLYGIQEELYNREQLLLVCDTIPPREKAELLKRLVPLLDYILHSKNTEECCTLCKMFVSLCQIMQP